MKLPNLLAGVAVVIAVTLAAYIGIYKMNWDKGSTGPEGTQTQIDASRDIFTYVPSDTLFFFGGLSTTSFEEAVKFMNAGGNWMQQAAWSGGLGEEEKSAMPPGARMINALMTRYIEILKDPGTAGNKLGIGKQVDAVSYSVGFIPVLRIKLADVSAFNKYIDEVESNEKLTPTKSTIGDVNLRSYSLDTPDAQEASGVNLIIGADKQYAVFSLTTKIEDDKTRQLIVGTSKPAKSIDAKAALEPIKARYGFHPAYIGYVNHKEIMRGLTGEGNSAFGKMLDAVINMAGEQPVNPADKNAEENAATGGSDNPLEAIRTEACRKEMMAMVDSWPQTVFGYTKMEFDSRPMNLEANMIFEGTDAKFMKAMQAIRGYIPKVLLNTSDRPAFGLGIGINMDALSPFVAQATQGFISKEYQCDALAQIKLSLSQSNPAMALGMMSGMVSGVQGVSITVLDVQGNLDVGQTGSVPEITALDAIVTISTSNPQQLLMMAGNFQPGMPPLQLPPDGTPVDLPVPLPIPALGQAKMALKGNHIVVYVGEKATKIANSLATEKLTPTGVFAFNIDFGKYMSLIVDAAKAGLEANQQSKATALSKKEQEMLDALSKIDMQLVETMDIRKEGIGFDIKMLTN